ncbi:hypothetical protein WDU94_013336 [Cyamophila willieti]
MCCVQAERVFPPSDSDESDDQIPRFLPGSRGQSSRSCPPRRDHSVPQWTASTSNTYLPGIGTTRGPVASGSSFNTTRRSFSSSLVAELKAVGPGPSLDECSFSVSAFSFVNYRLNYEYMHGLCAFVFMYATFTAFLDYYKFPQLLF